MISFFLNFSQKEAQDSTKPGKGAHHKKSQPRGADAEAPIEAAKAATKIIRTVDLWMRQRDLEQALLGLYPSLEKFTYSIALNQEVVKGSAELVADSEVAILPPFAGG